MSQTQYLIVGASHAALSALHAIRLHDAQGDITVVTKDERLPISPTVLPYVVSGRSDPARVHLRDTEYFERLKVDYRRGQAVSAVDTAQGRVRLADGAEIGFAKLLIATGAAPALPPIPGLESVRRHVLRSLQDALALRRALPRAKRVLVLGGGLIGMHAAENLVEAGSQVTVAEIQPHVLPGYLDAEASAIVERAFAERNVRLLTGRRVTAFVAQGEGCRTTLDDGSAVDADLLLVATGVVPATDFLRGSGIETDRGVLVDDWMRTSAANAWAAGDVAQAKGFFDTGKIINGILPDAVDQGRIAGMAMAGDSAVKPYAGGVPLNTYTFFGQHAVSVGAQETALDPAGVEVHKQVDEERGTYLKIVLRDDRLAGIFGINVAFDAGIMWELIRRRLDLGSLKKTFCAAPQDAARILMSRTWR
jgi:phenylglyoxylate dehydrogenase epsilon subunit